ncbi:MAG: LON peptidase substrate-binding domain-containing protein [Acidobacteriota bacterium]
MSSRRRRPRRMPILPLDDAVCFPQTDLRLSLDHPDDLELVHDLFSETAADGPRLGVVLRVAGIEGDDAPVYAAGTAARLVDVEDFGDRCEVVLRGEFRFELTSDVDQGDGREALVEPMGEEAVSEIDPEIQKLRSELVSLALELARELGERFDLDDETLRELRRGMPFERLVNHLAAHLAVAPERKLGLLREPLPRRARQVRTILRCRQQVLDALRPFRHLAAAAEHN